MNEYSRFLYQLFSGTLYNVVHTIATQEISIAFIKNLLLYVSIPTILTAIVFITRKSQKLDDLDTLVRTEIKPQLTSMEKRITSLEVKMISVENRLSSVESRLEIMSRQIDKISITLDILVSKMVTNITKTA